MSQALVKIIILFLDKLFFIFYIAAMKLKKIIFLIALFFPFSWGQAHDKLVCSAYFAYKYKPLVEHLKNDKAKHCVLSCFIAKDCFAGETFTLGLIKEVADLLGYGKPDWGDIRANIIGMRMAYNDFDVNCLQSCQEKFPE